MSRIQMVGTLIGGACLLVCLLCMLVAILMGHIPLAAWTGGWFGLSLTYFRRILAR